MVGRSWSTGWIKQWGIAAVVGVTAACTSIAGLDHDYELEETDEGEGGSGGAAPQGASGTGGGGVGGAGGSLPEDCVDGLDNDNDGLLDCADTSDCEPLVQCVPSIPPGWSQYVRYIADAFTGQPPEPPLCPDASQPTPYYMGPAGAPTCAACSCMWTGASCSAPEIECFGGNMICGGAVDASYTAQSENCIAMPNFSAPSTDDSCRIAGPAVVVNQGTCAASGGAMMAGLPWQEEVFACPVPVTDGGGCGSGQACAPKPGPDYNGSLCIQAEGVQACPSGWTAAQLTVYTDGSDTRACSSCACNNDLSCADDGYYTAYDENSCSGASAVVNGACTGNVSMVLGPDGSLKPKLASVKEGTCGGGQPMGSVAGTNPKTICCM